MTQAMQASANGDTKVDIPSVNRGDEVGQMAATVRVFKNHMVGADRMPR